MDIDLASVTQAEWVDAERVSGRTRTDLLDELDDGAVRVLSWLMLRRDDPGLVLDDVPDVDVSETAAARDSRVDVMARVCVALRMTPGEFRQMTPVEVAAVVNVLDEEVDGGS